MIPKTIHYCWFGRNPLPKDARKCIASWRKYFPDHEIKEWNEDNFDVSCNKYVEDAYRQKKYAFVSDYARFRVLHDHGGVYFDTDVEVIRPMDRIIAAGPFMGFEKSLATNGHGRSGGLGVNPGLGMAAEPGMPWMKAILDYYDRITFDISEGTIVYHTTRLLASEGLKDENKVQHVAGFTIYPDDYLCPMDSTTGIVTKTGNTVSIHHYSCSWMDHDTLSFRLHLLKNKLIKIFGPTAIMRVARLLKR
ncbi:MAG: glycosyl transferase [Muribaculaceae bacterium]|nr:glycosyl transferase [Muribaculaceae bacterium]